MGCRAAMPPVHAAPLTPDEERGGELSRSSRRLGPAGVQAFSGSDGKVLVSEAEIYETSLTQPVPEFVFGVGLPTILCVDEDEIPLHRGSR